MITTLVKQIRGLNRFSKLPDDEAPWVPNNLLKPGANVNNSIPEINLITRNIQSYFNDLIPSWLIRLECLKTNYIGLTSQASKDCKSLLIEKKKKKKKNYPKLELMVPLNNHIQSMITGCINVFSL